MSLERDQLIDLLLHVRQRPGMWMIRTHRELQTYLFGIGECCDLMAHDEILEWMVTQNDPRWGPRGGTGWTTRAASSVVPGYTERSNAAAIAPPDEPRAPTFTEEEERLMRDAIIDFAVAWLRRPSEN